MIRSCKTTVAFAAIATGFVLNISTANAGPYFGLSAGVSKADISKSTYDVLIQENISGSTLDDSDTALGAQIGYRWGKYIAAELGYVDLGEAWYRADVAGTTGRVSIRHVSSGPTLSVLGLLPITEKFDLYGKAGLFYSDLRIRVAAEDGNGQILASNEVKAHSKDAYAGIGAAWNISKKFAVRVEYQRFLDVGDSDRTGESDVDLITVGVLFQ
jgi:OmpA-OmpF porin, OOP family